MSLASKGAIIVRGGVLKFTHVVDNDTVHDVHTVHSCLQSLILDQLWYLSLTSDTDAHSAIGSRKRFTACDTQSYYFIIILFTFLLFYFLLFYFQNIPFFTSHFYFPNLNLNLFGTSM